jgi:hypothetical protein
MESEANSSATPPSGPVWLCLRVGITVKHSVVQSSFALLRKP